MGRHGFRRGGGLLVGRVYRGHVQPPPPESVGRDPGPAKGHTSQTLCPTSPTSVPCRRGPHPCTTPSCISSKIFHPPDPGAPVPTSTHWTSFGVQGVRLESEDLRDPRSRPIPLKSPSTVSERVLRPQTAPHPPSLLLPRAEFCFGRRRPPGWGGRRGEGPETRLVHTSGAPEVRRGPRCPVHPNPTASSMDKASGTVRLSSPDPGHRWTLTSGSESKDGPKGPLPVSGPLSGGPPIVSTPGWGGRPWDWGRERVDGH